MYTEGELTLKDGANNLYKKAINSSQGCCYEASCQLNYTVYGPSIDESQFVADIIVENSEEGHANARELVRRWNCFEDLLGACEAIHRAGLAGFAKWIGQTPAERELISAIKKWEKQIKEAIKKARL